MFKITVEVENMTTDENSISLTLPMSESEIHSKLMRDCEYLITDYSGNCRFENFDDIFVLNETLSRINAENPLITNELLEIILETSNYAYIDDEEFLEKICSNDFMYEEIVIPNDWGGTKEEYAAYSLFTEFSIPFAPAESLMTEAHKEGKSYKDWEFVWDVYSYMGFYMSEDDSDNNKIYIVNMEECEE